jgi:uncharacterized protein DUF5684
MGSLIYFLVVILLVVSWWIVFTKAKQPGWAILIPIYNVLVLLQIVGKPWWWIFLIIFLPFIFGIWVLNLLSIKFGKGVGFTIGLIFLSFIFVPILAFGDAKYKG